VADGHGYWSPSLLARIREHFAAAFPVSRVLTPLEVMVLSVLGAGLDDESAAERLGMRPSSVHSVRRQLHHKLGLQHRGDLMRFALEYGFVRFTETGVTHPGLGILRDACRPRSRGNRGKTRPMN
jgi:DNA-binding NarL/FixJ family response regulator